ncbi:MAG: hypothetical protein IJC33_06045 [Clostridia bacterium]|nr:hypothetical protein [Clostridia bacterium]
MVPTLIQKMALECAKCVQELGNELDSMEMLVNESKKAVIFHLELRLSRLEFVLTTKNSFMCPVGTLFVRVFPQKNRPLSLHLCELMAEDDFRSSYFPYNYSPEQLRISFEVLSDLVRELLPAVEALALDNDCYEQRLAEKCATLAQFGNVDTAPLREHLTEAELQEFLFAEWGEFYETFAQLVQFTQSEAYAAFVRGDIGKALKHYGKLAEKGQLEPYFVRLYAFLQTPEAHTFKPLPTACSTVYLQGRAQQYSVREGLQLLPAVGVLYVALLPLFYLITGGVHALVSAGAVYAPFGWGFLAILPLLPAVFGAMSLRRWLFPKLFPKDAGRWLAQDELENSKRMNTFCHVLFGGLGAVCLFFALMFTLAESRFYDDRMVYDNAANFPFPNPVTYAYEDIDKVYYIEGRWNAFDELVERGSYVLVFADGTAIDMDASISVKETEEHVLPLLDPYINEIITYPTDVELAKQYDKSVDDFFGYNDVAW